MQNDETKEVRPVQTLQPRAIFGLNGKIDFGLHLHPDGEHLVYPLGFKIGIDNLKTNKQEFIAGHTNNIHCLDISNRWVIGFIFMVFFNILNLFLHSGRYLASGQINHMGFPGFVILWDFAERREIARHDLHKVNYSFN